MAKLSGRADVVMREESRQHEGTVSWEDFQSMLIEHSGTQVLVRNFTRRPLEKKFISGFTIVKVLSNSSYEILKPNGQAFRVNVHHITPYGSSKGQKARQLIITESHNHVLRNRETLNAPDRLMY